MLPGNCWRYNDFFLSNTNFLESAMFKPCNVIIQQIESKFAKGRKPVTLLLVHTSRVVVIGNNKNYE